MTITEPGARPFSGTALHWLAAPEDELPHAIPEAGSEHGLPWKDTWWFALRDDAADVSIGLHMTLSPNRGPGSRVCVAVRQGGREVVDVLREPACTSGPVGNTLAALEVVDGAWTADKRLVWRASHPRFRLELRLAGRYFGPNVGRLCPGFLPTGKVGHSLDHVEQNGTFEGWLAWDDGPTIELSGHYWRDRSWGWRKSDTMFLAGTVLVGAHLPDATFTFVWWKNPEVAVGQPTPVAGWLADAAGVVPATGGRYRRESTGRPLELRLEFAGGRAVDLTVGAHKADLIYPFHEVEYDGSGVGVQIFDHHVDWVSCGQHPIPGLANHAHAFLADVLRDAEFKY